MFKKKKKKTFCDRREKGIEGGRGGGGEVELEAFVTSGSDKAEWSASHPGRFNPDEKFPGNRVCISQTPSGHSGD